MNSTSASVGFVLLCDERGIIQNVVRKGINVEGLEPGRSFENLVDPGSRIKLLNFLVELQSSGAVFDWEINFLTRKTPITLRLSGVKSKDSLMIVGARAPEDALNMYDEIIKINNELTTDLRTAIKVQMEKPFLQNSSDESLFNDISRLNNELITLQRELAKKNAELERLNGEVQELAITDQLTGWLNRRGFFERGSREIERAKRYKHPLAMIMFDLDHFKKINDTYGHASGDIVLTEISARCRRQLRTVDIFGRYGGEEFTVLLSETLLDGALNVAERLRASACEPLDIGQTKITVTISLGVAEMKDAAVDLEELIKWADKALYEAKETGRNRVCVY